MVAVSPVKVGTATMLITMDMMQVIKEFETDKDVRQRLLKAANGKRFFLCGAA